ncbi:MAG: universal stress protein [Salinisphaera sp.]|uniref:universal stress protein n=1 Tax=Salinisphaera sp. TaxID=1914330 RepID=UPI003C7B601E
MPREIFVPIDLSQPRSVELALPYAVDWARARNATLRLMTVLPDINAGMYPYVAVEASQESRELAQERLEEIAQAHIPSDVDCHTELLVGRMPRYLIDAINRGRPDLVVMAAHEPGIADVFLGSVSSSIVRHAHCPVLVVRDPEAQT